jgi:hypothetical protein
LPPLACGHASGRSAHQRRPFAVEAPARHEVLHGRGVVAITETFLVVELVGGGDPLLIATGSPVTR